jgi:hypothetical protein
MNAPKSNEYAEYYSGYVKLAESLAEAFGGDIVNALQKQSDDFRSLMRNVPSDRSGYAYAPGKWTIAQLVGHINDAERIFAYRLLCIARGETKSLPGFEQDDYVMNGGFTSKPLLVWVDDFVAARQSTLSLLRSLNVEGWERAGIANDKSISVKALAYILAGHVQNHINTLKSKYL